MKVLGIGYGRHLFDKENFEHKRLRSCATKTESLDHIIFSTKSDGLHSMQIDNFNLHATNSFTKLTMIYDAFRIGSRLISQKNIDVVSTQDLFETGLVGWLLKLRYPAVRLQVQEHGDVLSSSHWRRERVSNQLRFFCAQFVLRQADIIRVVSERTKKYLELKLGKEVQIKKLPVVIDSDIFLLDDQMVERKSGNTFTFLTAARFVPQKNFSLMLKALAEVKQELPSVRLRIFGAGPLQKKIISQISLLGLTDIVTLEPWSDNLGQEMRHADAYLLTSNYEGWGRVLIEAMLNRLPAVTTDVGCVGEVFLPETHGLVVPVDSVPELVNAMKKMISDRHSYQAYAKNLQSLNIGSVPGVSLTDYPTAWVKTLKL